MELRHLRYFTAVAEEQNVTRAAERLHVSQPAVSRQIRDLEDELGVPLFERTAKSLRLTDAGQAFLTEARAVLQRTEEAIKAVRAVSAGARGEIRVAYAPSLTIELLPQALRAFQSDWPGVRVLLHDLSTEEMLAQIRAGKVDLALGVHPGKSQMKGLLFQRLASYPICVALPPSHPLARRRAVTRARIAEEPMIGYAREAYPEYYDGIETLFTSAGRQPRIAEEHDGVTSLIAAVEAGRGFALVPSCIKCLAGPRLKLIGLEPPAPKIVVGALRREGRAGAAVERFIAASAMAG